MIYSIKCDKPSFKTVKFEPGFNVILAERTKESTKKDSRNGLGKSTLIEIIHFCLGGKKGETLNKSQLENWSFTLELDIGDKIYLITRNTSNANKIIISGDCKEWPIKPEKDKETGEQILSNNDWTKILGALTFGLQLSYPDMKYTPSYRSLISYFVRRNGNLGGFLNPFQHYKTQKEWDKQLHNAFLLGLGWEYAAKGQILKDQNNVIEQIKQGANFGILQNLMGSIGELEAVKIRLQDQASRGEEQLSNFKIYPEYKTIENEANELTNKIHNLVNQNVSDSLLIQHYESNLKEEVEAQPEIVTNMYKEAGILLPDTLTKRIDDVISFHKQVVTNRKSFLETEIKQLKSKIAERERESADLSSKRSDLMKILQQHGALDEYIQIQNKHQRTVAELSELKIRIDNLKKFEQGKNALTVEQLTLQQQASTDLEERKTQKEEAILLFNSNSKALYEVPGTLSIDFLKTGFKFNVNIERSGSHGISNMKIFCYDLVLAQLWAKRSRSPIFLIHDSILFADVDERQKALALEVAAKESKQKRFQYICTLNSDNIPKKDFRDDFDFESYVREVFTDATEDGGLLGFRF